MPWRYPGAMYIGMLSRMLPRVTPKLSPSGTQAASLDAFIGCLAPRLSPEPLRILAPTIAVAGPHAPVLRVLPAHSHPNRVPMAGLGSGGRRHVSQEVLVP